MQALAAWLKARPQFAILGLAATLLLPIPGLTSFVSSILLVFLVMAHGVARAMLEVAVAGAILLGGALFAGIPLVRMLELMMVFWLPALLAAVILQKTRSLALTVQLSVIVAILGLTAFFVVTADPVAFWEPMVAEAAEAFRANGLELNTELLELEYMTVSAVWFLWLIGVAAMLLGYGIYRALPEETVEFGRFHNLKLGRVLAVIAMLAAIPAMVIDGVWLNSVAFILFGAFWLQGLAIVHWLHAGKVLPLAAVAAVYVLIPLTQVLALMMLAITGYLDAWFDFRRRMKKA